jgi:hypothetical protein
VPLSTLTFGTTRAGFFGAAAFFVFVALAELFFDAVLFDAVFFAAVYFAVLFFLVAMPRE